MDLIKEEMNRTEQNISKLMYVFFNYDTYERENEYQTALRHKNQTALGHKNCIKACTLGLINLLGKRLPGFGDSIEDTQKHPLSLKDIKYELAFRISYLLNNQNINQTIKEEWDIMQVFDIIEHFLNGKKLMFSEQSKLIKTLQEFFPHDDTLQAVDCNQCDSCNEYLSHLKPEAFLNNSKLKILKWSLFQKYKNLWNTSKR